MLGQEIPQMTPMMEGAVQAHELFISYVNAGFTRPEALHIVVALMVNSLPGKNV